MVQTEYLATPGEELGRLAEAHQELTINPHYSIQRVAGFQFLVNVHDTSMRWSLQSAQEEIEDMIPMCQGLVIDIGANVGSHSVAFSKAAQRVISFEPQPHTYRVLCANLAINCCANVEAHQVALGNREDQVLILPIDPAKDHSSPGARLAGYGESVRLAMLDSFGYNPISFIKIDVEEMELDVLQGAEQTLKSQSPIVYVEIHNDSLLELVPAYMTSLGYKGVERVIQHNAQIGILTHGWLFWKEGRIAWV